YASSVNPLKGGTFLRACRREKADYTPIWIMRQAGRYLAEYRELRSRFSFLDMCKSPELATQITLMPVDRFDLDAAIIFSDILLIAEPMGMELEFRKGEGPKFNNPVRSGKDIDRLREVEPADSMSFVFEAIKHVRESLKPEISLIGFCGAPFTLAGYMIEGGGSRDFQRTRSLMVSNPGAWHGLMEKLCAALAKYLNGQIDAGAQAVQLFDSWVGCLNEADYRAYVLDHIEALVKSIRPTVPVIYFGTNTSELLKSIGELSVDVIGVDWRVELSQGWETIGYDKAIQGNPDPEVLLTNPSEIRRQARSILTQAGGRPGHIFNLGHGILPETPVDNVLSLIETVHEYRSS
ncbi:MAG: uroporphyrinogen decarboxylase, partial [Planctomycetota bacterium]